MTLGKLAVFRNDTKLLLPGEYFFAQTVPALVKLALVLVRPFLGYMMWSVSSTRREVGEERLIGHERLLLADPIDCLVGHILGEVITFLRGLMRLDRGRALVDCRI